MTGSPPCGYCLEASMTDPATLWIPAYAGMTVRDAGMVFRLWPWIVGGSAGGAAGVGEPFFLCYVV